MKMVKTRHAAEGDGDQQERFATIGERRTRHSNSYTTQTNGYESDDSEPSPFSEGRRTTRSRTHTHDTELEEIDSDFTPARRVSKRQRHPKQLPDDEIHFVYHSARKKSHSKCDLAKSLRSTQYNDEDTSIRRSTRQRKLVYSTFNQNLIEKHIDYLSKEPTDDEEEEDAAMSTEEEEEEIENKNPKKKRKLLSELEKLKQDQEESPGLDMYSRVKRTRRQVKRDMYGMPVAEDDQNGESQTESEDDDDETDSSEDSSSNEQEEAEEPDEEIEKQRQRYSLREHKPRTDLYTAPIEPKRTRTRRLFQRNDTPPRRTGRNYKPAYRSPAHRTPRKEKKRRAAFHGSSSTSSSGSSSGGDESDDERRFERRKAKSMAKSRSRCLPMNFDPSDINSGIVRDRMKIGSSLADVDPMNIDRSVTFESVGGLGKHIRALKEMVVFPLLYPEVFENFKISPPRGCLFYGPPGTGKTLVARALANECSIGEKKVAFFMRKGADCLSKWVGESERQLRLLFDQAYQMRPSIIFFDEIDGLAPVRSSRQDQIHSSIVSTLLALMDGLDNRGEIVVIGATNRIDSIDPALRRPGRFDREFLFPLPSVEARQQILEIHTSQWQPKLCKPFLEELAENCVGYCGADLKALCTEAALQALRRRYPQIYTTSDKLELDVTSISVSAKDFLRGMQNIVPASQRSNTSPGRSLMPSVRPLLKNVVEMALEKLATVFPVITAKCGVYASSSQRVSPTPSSESVELDFYSDDEEDAPSIFDTVARPQKRRIEDVQSFMSFASAAYQCPATHRPRLLLTGTPGQGQTIHIAPAIVHRLEKLPVHTLDLPALFGVSAKTPEESCAQIFREARRNSPSIVYIPHIMQWWNVQGDTMRATFLTLLKDLEPSAPLLLLATCDIPHERLPKEVKELFDIRAEEVIIMQNPTDSERREFFQDLLLVQTTKLPPSQKQSAQRMLEVLPKAKPQEPRKLTDNELKKIHQQEEATLRELRLFLRDVLNKLGKDRKFGIFAKPVDPEDVPDYAEIITQPMDLSTMMSKIDLHIYDTVQQFLDDIELICKNALEYNPDTDTAGRAIRHRACALKDMASAIMLAELDPEFEKLCQEIQEARKRRGEEKGNTLPSYYYTKPKAAGDDALANYPTRFSRRTRGMEVESTPPTTKVDIQDKDISTEPKVRAIIKRVPITQRKANSARQKHKSPWCRPGRRKRFRKIVVQVDEYGNEIVPSDKEKDEKEETEEIDVDEDEVKDENEGEDEKSIETEEQADKHVSKNIIEFTAPRTRSRSPRTASPGAGKSSVPTIVKSSPNSLPSEGNPESLSVDVSLPSKPVTRLSPSYRTRSLSNSSADAPMKSPRTSTDSQQPGRRTSVESQSKSPKYLTDNPSTPKCASDTNEKGKETQENSAAGSTKSKTDDDSFSQTPTTRFSERIAEKVSNAENKVSESAEKPEDTIPSTRTTRSQSSSAHILHAKKILEEPIRTLEVDMERLQLLLNKTVELTRGYTVDKLERLYSVMSQNIYYHRKEYNKTQLIENLENTLTQYCQH